MDSKPNAFALATAARLDTGYSPLVTAESMRDLIARMQKGDSQAIEELTRLAATNETPEDLKEGILTALDAEGLIPGI